MMKSLLTVILAGFLAAVSADETESARTGYAYSLETGQLLYVERHREIIAGDEVVSSEVVYTDASGSPLASKRIDFTSGSMTPDFLLENQRTGHSEGVLSSAGVREVLFRSRDTEVLKREAIVVPGEGIIDAGFDRFIDKYWGELIAGERFVRPFLVPSRGGFVDFRIGRDETREAGSEYAFVLEVEAAWLRWLVDPIVVSYDRSSGKLLRYEGLSNMRDTAGNNYNVRIEFAQQSGEAVATASE